MDNIVLGKSFKDFSKEMELLIKEYLLTCPEDSLTFYCIKVPENLEELTGEEFMEFVLKIQPKVYKASKKIGMTTPLYVNMNKYLFANHKPIKVCDVPNPPDIEV